MDKQEAIRLLGGSLKSAADEIGVTVQAISQWPEALPPRIADRIAAALWRKSQGIPAPSKSKAEAE